MARLCKRGHEQTEDNIARDKSGRHKGCKLCGRIKVKEWYTRNRERANASSNRYYYENREQCLKKARRNVLKRNYGITPQEFDRYYTGQKGLCANTRCLRPLSEGWHVDHDHATNIFRGILCKRCNWALGHVKDKIEILLGLVDYLNVARDLRNKLQEKFSA